MFEWFFDIIFLENQKGLFTVSVIVIVSIIITTFFLVYKEIKGSKC